MIIFDLDLLVSAFSNWCVENRCFARLVDSFAYMYDPIQVSFGNGVEFAVVDAKSKTHVLGKEDHENCPFYLADPMVFLASILSILAFSNLLIFGLLRYRVTCAGTMSVLRSLIRYFAVLIRPRRPSHIN